MRWWLLKTVASWCGLRVGLLSMNDSGLPTLVIFSREDRLAFQAMGIIAQFVNNQRRHSEWTH